MFDRIISRHRERGGDHHQTRAGAAHRSPAGEAGGRTQRRARRGARFGACCGSLALVVAAGLLLPACTNQPSSGRRVKNLRDLDQELRRKDSQRQADSQREGESPEVAEAPSPEGAAQSNVAQRADEFAEQVQRRLSQQGEPERPGGEGGASADAGGDADGSEGLAGSAEGGPPLRPGAGADQEGPSDQPTGAVANQSKPLVTVPGAEGPTPPDTAESDGASEGKGAEEMTAGAEAGDGSSGEAAAVAERSLAGQPPPQQPVDLSAVSTELLTEELSDRMRRRGGSGDVRDWLAASALALFDPSLALAESQLESVSPDRRRMLLAYQEAFSLLGESLGEDPAGADEQLRLAAERLHRDLKESRPLNITTARLCTQVNGYGVYEPLSDNTFSVGREHPVIVYTELENFTPERTDGGLHVTRLQQQIVLYNESDGLAVWRVEPTDIVDRSRNRRRDFFVVQIIRLPAKLTVGKYQLKITITDEVGEEVDEEVIPIRITADDG